MTSNPPINSNRDFPVIHRISARVLNDCLVAANCTSCDSALDRLCELTKRPWPTAFGLYVQVTTMRRWVFANAAPPSVEEISGPAKSAHSYSV